MWAAGEAGLSHQSFWKSADTAAATGAVIVQTLTAHVLQCAWAGGIYVIIAPLTEFFFKNCGGMSLTHLPPPHLIAAVLVNNKAPPM